MLVLFNLHKNVIASGHVIDYMKIALGQWLMKLFIKKVRGYTKKSFIKMMKKEDISSWKVNNLVHITRIEDPLKAFKYSMELNKENLYFN